MEKRKIIRDDGRYVLLYDGRGGKDRKKLRVPRTMRQKKRTERCSQEPMFYGRGLNFWISFYEG